MVAVVIVKPLGAGLTARSMIVDGRDLVRAAIPALVGGGVGLPVMVVVFTLIGRSMFGQRKTKRDDAPPPTSPAA